MADVLAWLPLGATATAYFAALGKQAGDATWIRLARSRRSKEADAVSELATALAKAADCMGSNAEIVLGLEDADGVWSMAIAIKDPDPQEVARVLGTFVVHVEQLAAGVRAEVDAGRGPRAPAAVEVDLNGDLVAKWRARVGEAVCAVRVPTSRTTDSGV